MKALVLTPMDPTRRSRLLKCLTLSRHLDM